MSWLLFVNSEGFPCRSISSLGALEGASVWICECVRRRRRRRRRLQILDFTPLELGSKKTVSNGLGHNSSKESWGWNEFKAFILTFRDLASQLCQTNNESGWPRRFGV